MKKLPITREKFKKYIEAIERINNIDKSIRDILRDNKCDSDFFAPDFSLADELTEVLDILMHKPNEYCDDINYFVFELECGKKYEPGCVTTRDDEPIDFSDADAIYTYLEKLWNE